MPIVVSDRDARKIAQRLRWMHEFMVQHPEYNTTGEFNLIILRRLERLMSQKPQGVKERLRVVEQKAKK